MSLIAHCSLLIVGMLVVLLCWLLSSVVLSMLALLWSAPLHASLSTNATNTLSTHNSFKQTWLKQKERAQTTNTVRTDGRYFEDEDKNDNAKIFTLPPRAHNDPLTFNLHSFTTRTSLPSPLPSLYIYQATESYLDQSRIRNHRDTCTL